MDADHFHVWMGVCMCRLCVDGLCAHRENKGVQQTTLTADFFHRLLSQQTTFTADFFHRLLSQTSFTADFFLSVCVSSSFFENVLISCVCVMTN